MKREFSFGGDLGGLRARRFLEDDGLKDVCDKRVEFLGGGLGA